MNHFDLISRILMTKRMPLTESLRAIWDVRTEEIVVTNMGTAREWMTFGSHPLDFILVPSSMGQATTFGLGLALAQPHRRVVVCNGDGAMLMNLGSLVTITAEAPPNFTLVLFDNGVYEITGRQATAATPSVRHRESSQVDFSVLARGSGFENVRRYNSLETWRDEAHDVIHRPGPVFIHLSIEPTDRRGPSSPSPAAPRARRFAAALRE